MAHKPPRVLPDERAAIAADLRAGLSIHRTAARHGRSKDTVARIGRGAGIVARPAPGAAIRAHRDFARAERMAAIDLAAEEVLDGLLIAGPHEILSAVTALATLIDKRRLEEGEVSGATRFRRAPRST